MKVRGKGNNGARRPPVLNPGGIPCWKTLPSHRVSSLSQANLVLNALIEGRKVESTSKTPGSVLEVFRNPQHFRYQNLTGLLTEISERLQNEVHEELEARPLGNSSLQKLKNSIESFGLPEYRYSMCKKSIEHGEKFLEELGFFIKAEELDSPRTLLLEVLSLAQVGRLLTEWIKESEVAKVEEERVVGLAQLQIIAEMILERDAKWVELKDRDEEWRAVHMNLTAIGIIEDYEQGRDFIDDDVRLFGNKEDRDFTQGYLRGIAIRHADFPYSNFRQVDLREAILKHANLEGSNFREANLEGGYFEGSKIQNACFYLANLSDAKFAEADLRGADLRKANLVETGLTKANLKGARLDSLDLTGTTICLEALWSIDTGEWAREKGLVNLINAWRARGGRIVFRDMDLSPFSFPGINLSDTDFPKTRLQGSYLLWGNLQGANLSNTGLHDNNLKYLNLRESNLSGAFLLETDLEGADLTGANLSGAKIDFKTLLTLNTGQWSGQKTLAEKINAWRARQGELFFIKVDFSGKDLSGADFRDAKLYHIKFYGANLKGIKIKGAELKKAKIDRKALKTLRIRDIGFWSWLRAGGKKKWWQKMEGIVVDE